MAGQAIVIINDKQWSAGIASDTWELAQGLSGIPELAPGTGMLFDLGYEQYINVTTEAMLFPLDIVFISESMTVTELIQSLAPGQRLTTVFPARYFLEVNAGEMDGINLGDQAIIDPLPLQEANEPSYWMNMILPLVGFALMSAFIVDISGETRIKREV